MARDGGLKRKVARLPGTTFSPVKRLRCFPKLDANHWRNLYRGVMRASGN